MANHADPSPNLLRTYGGAIILAVFIALAIRFFIIEAYRIPSAAMRPTLESGDTIFVAKWPFGLRFPWSAKPLTSGRVPAAGEVVIFSHPDNPNHDFIKRVVGLPGDVIEMKGGKIRRNGKPLTEASAPQGSMACGQERIDGNSYGVCWEPPLIADFAPQKVPEGSVFVVGDLRSTVPNPDSHLNSKNFPKGWGIVPSSTVKGKALWIWLSIEPRGLSAQPNWFSRIRFDRMFQPIR